MYFQIDGLELDAVRVKGDADKFVFKRLATLLGCELQDFSECLIKNKSIDSRRSKVQIVYSLFVKSQLDLASKKSSVKITPVSSDTVKKKYAPELHIARNVSNDSPIIIVGTGPAGIFAALSLARANFKVIILDRGKKVDERSQDQQKFLAGRILDEDSNLLIGEGGAGTFSDGKLFTRTKDPDSDFVLKTFV